MVGESLIGWICWIVTRFLACQARRRSTALSRSSSHGPFIGTIPLSTEAHVPDLPRPCSCIQSVPSYWQYHHSLFAPLCGTHRLVLVSVLRHWTWTLPCGRLKHQEARSSQSQFDVPFLPWRGVHSAIEASFRMEYQGPFRGQRAEFSLTTAT